MCERKAMAEALRKAQADAAALEVDKARLKRSAASAAAKAQQVEEYRQKAIVRAKADLRAVFVTQQLMHGLAEGDAGDEDLQELNVELEELMEMFQPAAGAQLELVDKEGELRSLGHFSINQNFYFWMSLPLV